MKRILIKKNRFPWVICLSVLFLGGPLHAAPWNALYVFGDSYSDSGAGYADINGPTAVVYLARELGIPFTHANDPERAGKSLNFAVSGAQSGTGDARKVKDATLSLGMQNQVQLLSPGPSLDRSTSRGRRGFGTRSTRG